MRFFFFLVLLMVVFSGCGKSPLFNHEKERDPTPSKASQQTNESECNLTLNRCDFRLGDLCSEVSFRTGPIVGENQLTLKFSAPLDCELSVLPEMPEHGHGTAPVAIERVCSNLFRVSDIWLIMEGLWVFKVSCAEKSGAFEVRL